MMSDSVILRRTEDPPVAAQMPEGISIPAAQENPPLSSLQEKLAEASLLVDDIVLKKYLHELTSLKIVPLNEELDRINDIRLFKITEMVYQKDEYSTYKFASVFNAVQNLNCGVFILANSDGQKTDFYMGVRSLDDMRTTKSLKDTLRNALVGQFPGVKTADLQDSDAKAFLEEIPSKNIASVSCVANNKDEEFKDNTTFIQGLEKLALAMQGQKYTAIVLAKSTPTEQLYGIRKAYETIYTQLSPFSNMQLSYGSNTALSMSDALSHGTTTGSTFTKGSSESKGTSRNVSTSTNESVSKPDTLGCFVKTVGTVALGIASVATAPLTGGESIAAASAITIGHVGLGMLAPEAKTHGGSVSESQSENESKQTNESFSQNESKTDTATQTRTTNSGTSENMQLTMQNKTLLNTLERVDMQLKRLDECESLGMWECAAYFLSDSQETAEMAAGTYKSLMKGAQSGVETSAINYWGWRNEGKKLPLLRKYLTNFIHPVFKYQTPDNSLLVTASSLVSSNELAIQMGLPRKSVCGFPVIEHADFGKEVVSYNASSHSREIQLGQIFSMGTVTDTNVSLNIDSLTMHTFVTGSTGAGKSNTVYEILDQVHSIYKIPFMVVEPAKGEYKNVFSQYPDVTVYGTNPQKTKLLKINPFSFPDDVHVLEHMDRLVEIFNVCWPMYAAMPAILKEAMEKAYVATGWDMERSVNPKGRKFPNFADLLEQIETVINESKYSSDSKGDYSGALLTRVRSLTTGLNRLIFCNDEIADADLFDKSIIVDLSRIGSAETKSLLMGLMIMKLNEYRMSSGKINSNLAHITVLEEAHNLLKRTSTEQSSESANLLGKSVELLANSIAEMRTYGEGFIIADQSPGLLDMSVIRNTNTKIILRLPDRSDRELVGYSAGLREDQVDELSKLKRGVAAVYQNDWIEPVLVHVNKCSLKETHYEFVAEVEHQLETPLKTQIVRMMIQGRLDEKLEFSVEDIEAGLSSLDLSVSNIEFLEEQIAEYKESKSLEIWSDSNFRSLARRITDILGVRSKVETCVLNATDDEHLTSMLEQISLQVDPNTSIGEAMALSQCFMKDMSVQKGEEEAREKIYCKWVNHIREGRVK